MTDLFVEVFPLAEAALPDLTAYRVHGEGDRAGLSRLGARLAARLRRTYSGDWLWADGHILTDSPRSAVELAITLDLLKQEQPAVYAAVTGLEEVAVASPAAQAEFVLRARLKPLDDAVRAALDQAGKAEKPLRGTHIEREHRMQPWVVRGAPAVSLSIASRLLLEHTLHEQIAGADDAARAASPHERWVGLWVKVAETGQRGEIVNLVPEGDTWRVSVRVGAEEADYPAEALRVIVRLPEVARFALDPKQALVVLQMKPATRAYYVRAASDVVKGAALITNAYNSRTAPDLFASADFEMNLRFSRNRVRPYHAKTLAEDFAQCGAYRLRPEVQAAPLRACVVNTLPLKLEDFVEAMQRHLARHFDFTLDILRERQVRVFNRANVTSAIRVVEKENPDIILAFFPDEAEDRDDDDSGDSSAMATYLRSLTLGRALPIHAIRQATLDDPEAMGAIILGMLGKTGSVPFVLAEPLDGVDYVIGLVVVRETRKPARASDPVEVRLTAIARVYKADGEFLRYTVRELRVQDESLPYVLLRDLFPQREFAHKRVVLHHDGDLAPDLLAALTGWGQAIGAAFYPVEIDRFGSPRLYGTEGGQVIQPPWGSAFRMSEREALLVSSVPAADVTPQPLHIRTLDAGGGSLPIDVALRSVLVWSLLNYEVGGPSKLPVTVNNTDDLAYWLRKGGTLGTGDGRVPFWL